jgi:ABC-type polysaccharide/polyol phosphate export permease
MKDAVLDIAAAQKRWRLIGMLGYRDLKHRYRRSLLGPFWLSVSTAVFIAIITLVFGSVLDVPMRDYLPYIATGIIFWQFITSTITSSCSAFVASSALIKQSAVPMYVYVEKELWRELLTLAHNLLILPMAFIIVRRGIDWTALLAIPGFLLLLANLGWMSLLLAVLATRYRDLPQTVNSLLPTLMFVTPIIWLPSMMPTHLGKAFVAYNPLARLIELVREPLLGHVPSITTWIVGAAMAILGWLIALYIFGRGRRRIVYWL